VVLQEILQLGHVNGSTNKKNPGTRTATKQINQQATVKYYGLSMPTWSHRGYKTAVLC
jgi:hypothetical protein